MSVGETRSLTVTLTAGVTSFNFTQLEPVQASYKEGDSVYVKITVKNNGTVAGGATIVVKDAGTGATIDTYSTPEVQPGYSWATSGSHAYVGKMPNKNWALQFVLTP